MRYEHHQVSAEEMYFFDLRGYLVVPGILGSDEIDAVNRALDAKMSDAVTLEAGESHGRLRPHTDHGDAGMGARTPRAVP